MKWMVGQKAPSAKRCIKTTSRHIRANATCPCQKAPSAKRCIKTGNRRRPCNPGTVRKRRAPKGALRPIITAARRKRRYSVRKHRAPKGALRRDDKAGTVSQLERRQNAPSAKRCIKTKTHNGCRGYLLRPGQKASSAKRCI